MKKFFILLVLAPAAGWATVNQIEFDIGRGIPRSALQAGASSDEAGSQGHTWSADFLHVAANYLYFGIGGGEFHSDDNFSGTFVPNANSTLSSRVTSILGLMRVDLSPNPKVKTYAIVGLGWARNSLSVSASPVSTWSDTGTNEQRMLLDRSKDTLGYAAGLGMDFAINDRLFIGVEGRYQGSMKESYDLTPAGVAATGRTSVASAVNAFLLSLKAGVKY